MADAKEAWNEVGAQFSGLGERLKEHFNQPVRKSTGVEDAPPTETAEAPTGATASGATESGATETGTGDALKAALKTLGEALDGVVEAIGGAAKDPAVVEDVRHVGQSLVNALSATFSDASDEIRKAFNRNRAGDGAADDARGGTDDVVTVVDTTTGPTSAPSVTPSSTVAPPAGAPPAPDELSEPGE